MKYIVYKKRSGVVLYETNSLPDAERFVSERTREDKEEGFDSSVYEIVIRHA